MTTYRVGRHNPRNIYRDDQHIGCMFDPADGPLVVAALNHAQHPEPDRPPHPTCKDATTWNELAAGRRTYICGRDCPPAGEHTEGHP